jgi:AtzE family amidohydrolase
MIPAGIMTGWSAGEIAAAVRGGSISAAAIIEARLARIASLDPKLNCFTELLADRARREADEVDSMVAAGRDPGPLAGVPYGIKDNYDIAGRITTAGSIVNRSLPPARSDAVVARRLRNAGAVLLGAQNMDEFAYGFTTENAHYGPAHNPRDLERSAGGSSGGSAASVAAGLTDFSMGTDTNGSIRVPSSFCGIFGLKPTFGRLPRTGTFPFVHELDHLGPFARSAADLALIYDAVQGHDRGDAGCAGRAPEPVSHRIADMPPVRIGILSGWFEELAGEEAWAAVQAVAQSLGATETVILPGAGRARAAAFVLTAASGANLHREALHARAEDFDPATRGRLLAGLLLPADAIVQAQRVRQLFRAQLMEALRHHDVLIAAATPFPAPLLGQATIRLGGEEVPTRPNIGVLTQPLSFAGIPIVTVPVKRAGLPIGVQIVTPSWREDLALQVAARLERDGIVAAPVAEPC